MPEVTLRRDVPNLIKTGYLLLPTPFVN